MLGVDTRDPWGHIKTIHAWENHNLLPVSFFSRFLSSKHLVLGGIAQSCLYEEILCNK